MEADYLKIPCEMVRFALKTGKKGKIGPVQCYTVSQFLFSGKAHVRDKPLNKIASVINKNVSTVYRYFDWLLERNWFGKDKKNGWYFFRGFDQVHKIEDWKYRRAAVVQFEDIKFFKAFCISAFLASLIKTGKGAETDRVSGRSLQSGYPISLKTIQKTLDCSRKTAFNYRKLAKKKGYIKMRANLLQADGISVSDVQHLRSSDIKSIEVDIFGSKESIDIYTDRLRVNHGLVYIQMPNVISSYLLLKKTS